MRLHPSKIMILAGLILGGCASESTLSPEPQLVVAQTPMTTHFVMTIDTPLDPAIPLTLKQAWPLLYKESNHGRYLQKIKTSVQDQDFTITVHLSIGPNKIEFIALNDIYGRVYDLVWTPDSITWKASEHLPESVHPENILADFLLVHLPAEVLRKCLDSATTKITLSEEGATQNSKRVLKSGSGIMREIHRQGPLGPLWQSVTLTHPKYKYNLDIQTVQLP